MPYTAQRTVRPGTHLRLGLALLIGVGLALLACSAGAEPASSEGPLSPKGPSQARVTIIGPSAVIETATYSGLVEPVRTVVRDPNAWAALWERAHETMQPPPERPAIDFEREMVVAVASGHRSTGGYGIAVDSMRAQGDARTFYVTTRSPGVGCLTTQAITAPYQFVRVPRAEGPVEFVETERRSPC